MSDQATATPATEESSVQLQLQDLLLAAQVIQIASQRGAIKAEEMEQVGGLYTRLVQFLQASGVLQPVTPATDAPKATATPATDAPDAPAAE